MPIAIQRDGELLEAMLLDAIPSEIRKQNLPNNEKIMRALEVWVKEIEVANRDEVSRLTLELKMQQQEREAAAIARTKSNPP